MKIIREDSKLSAIQRVLLDYSNLIIPNLRDLLSDFLARIFVIFALFTNYINKSNIFKSIIYK